MKKRAAALAFPLALAACGNVGPWMPEDALIVRTVPAEVERYDGRWADQGIAAWSRHVGGTWDRERREWHGGACVLHVPDGPDRGCYLVTEYVRCSRGVDPGGGYTFSAMNTPFSEQFRWHRTCHDHDWAPEVRRLGLE